MKFGETQIDPATGKPMTLLPRGSLDKKPPHGAPCNRCGLCCMATLCPLARAVFDRPDGLGPCPALTGEIGSAGCGLVETPERFRPTKVAIHGRAALRDAAARLIGAGDGCDSRINGETVNEKYAAWLKTQVDARATRKARKVWGVANPRFDGFDEF